VLFITAQTFGLPDTNPIPNQLIEEQKSGLVKEKIITMDEANLFFGYGYAKARNTLPSI